MNELEVEKLERKEWDIIRKYLESSDNTQQFYYALWSNYDDNQKPLKWLISNPNTELATILAIYYNLEPSYYTKYRSLDEVTKSELGHFNFLRKIEENVDNKFYKNSTICFSPSEWEEKFDDEAPRPIPLFMREEVKGKTTISCDYPEGYDEGLPLAVYSEIWNLYQ
ncbi:DUF4274 domain-containing protein [Poseidonibacter lekithochrous]|uniref:DUF4274 domain-containing protein n=1 Tax=Poseidonibacter TaxID=2321187 RepID=UPI001C09D299|nr:MULTISPECIES: DUF4274 domain-containing protein [Poseidonibacter]MBU3014023.1 DUF4274 domain-containing protein [Poseidonibacter lekithochrous]MDO6827319.1 DUF4274 domain-containing protein [Poseidonibacter sp. 1_MG-2023]